MDIANNSYDPGEDFVSPEDTAKFVSLGFKNYYDVLTEQERLKLLDLNNSHPVITFKKIVRRINNLGTISPNGPILNTPDKIKNQIIISYIKEKVKLKNFL